MHLAVVKRDSRVCRVPIYNSRSLRHTTEIRCGPSWQHRGVQRGGPLRTRPLRSPVPVPRRGPGGYRTDTRSSGLPRGYRSINTGLLGGGGVRIHPETARTGVRYLGYKKSARKNTDREQRGELGFEAIEEVLVRQSWNVSS
jgi:hypothetical protein